MALDAFVWPATFPDGCPPPDAVPAAGQYYRIVNSDPPTRADFRAWRDDNPTSSKNTPGAWGTSVFGELEDIKKIYDQRRIRSRVPGTRRWMLALGSLVPSFGVLSVPVSKNSHRDWWIPSDVDPSSAFNVLTGVL